MKHLVFLASAALITAVPAYAQDSMGTAPPTDTTAPAEPTMPPTDATQLPTTDDAAAAAAAAAAGAAGPPPPAAADAPVAAAPAADIQAQWAQYDKDSKGYLTPLEFGTWVLARQGQDLTATVEKTRTSKKAGLPAVKVLNATASEFSKADGDHNNQVSPQELANYLAM